MVVWRPRGRGAGRRRQTRLAAEAAELGGARAWKGEGVSLGAVDPLCTFAALLPAPPAGGGGLLARARHALADGTVGRGGSCVDVGQLLDGGGPEQCYARKL